MQSVFKMLFFHAQSFEYIHERAYILKDKRPVEGRSYLLQKKVPLLNVLSHCLQKDAISPKTPKKIQKLLKYFKTELLRRILKFYTGHVLKADFLLNIFQQK